jgi:hypothetical protein
MQHHSEMARMKEELQRQEQASKLTVCTLAICSCAAYLLVFARCLLSSKLCVPVFAVRDCVPFDFVLRDMFLASPFLHCDLARAHCLLVSFSSPSI